jgi:predicted amidohydrolase
VCRDELEARSVATPEHDLVISGGRLMDPESGTDAVLNVGVTDGSISAVTDEDISGGETIDATGHVVAPGFIDLHVHTTDSPFSQKLGLRDGVCTQLDLETGAHPVDPTTTTWQASRRPTTAPA